MVVVFIPLITLSCRSTTDNPEKEGKVTVKINLLGVAETSDTSISSSRMIPVAYVAEVPYDKNFNLVATITPEVPAIKTNAQTAVNPSALTITPQPPTTSPIGVNVKYLVMVFDENGNRITAQEKVYDSSNQSNTADQIILNAGQDYTVVAISYNSAIAPVFNAAVTTISDVFNTVTVDHTSDYLYLQKPNSAGNPLQYKAEAVNIFPSSGSGSISDRADRTTKT